MKNKTTKMRKDENLIEIIVGEEHNDTRFIKNIMKKTTMKTTNE